MTFDPTKPVRTRGGRKARIICQDLADDQPIVAAVMTENGGECLGQYSEQGSYYRVGVTHTLDLVNVPERVERWANVYGPHDTMCAYQYKDKYTANIHANDMCKGQIKLVYEDDKLVEVTLEKE